MLSKLRDRLHRPSPAMVVAMISLFVALGGTSVAAVSLTRNSVKNRHIAANAVTSPKVKNASLRSQDFAPGQLPRGEKGDQGEPGAAGTPGAPGRDGTAAGRETAIDVPLPPAPGTSATEERVLLQDGPLTISAECTHTNSEAEDADFRTLRIKASSSQSGIATTQGNPQTATNEFGREGTPIPAGGSVIVAEIAHTHFVWYGGAPFSATSGGSAVNGVLSYSLGQDGHHCVASLFGG